MTPNLTSAFIDGLLRKSQNIPISVIAQAKKCVLDYMGVVVGGARFVQKHHPEFFKSYVLDNGDCSVFGTELKTSSLNAALLNGYSAHVLELDDGHRRGMIHLGASVISAILSVAEQDNMAQKDILKGIVIGYEAAVRCACALQPGHKVRGYHVSGTCGTIGSAIGVGFAKGFTFKQLKSTVSCAVTSAAGVLEIQEEASELKPYNLGRAAMDGVAAARIGALAVIGPDDILGGKRGLLSVLTDTPTPDYLMDFSDNTYCIEKIYQKVYAACRHCHPAIEAAIAIRNDIHFHPEQVDSINVFTYKLAVGGHNHTNIQGLSSAKLSTPFSVALAVVKGDAGVEDFNEDILHNPDIIELTRKVCVVEDEQFTAKSPSVRGARVVIRLKDKKEYDYCVLYPKGEPENPISYEEILMKTRQLVGDYQNSFLEGIIYE